MFIYVVCLCVYAMGVVVRRQPVEELASFPYYGGSGKETVLLRLGRKCPHPLQNFASLVFYFLISLDILR